jgi:hypothetical protein
MDGVIIADNTYGYLKGNLCDFAGEFYDYMYPRKILAVMLTLLGGKDKELFNRLCYEYDVKFVQ